MSILHIAAKIRRQLTGLYLDTEIESFVRILFQHFLGMTSAQIHLSHDNEPSDKIVKQIMKSVDELKKYRPIQYILGETEFFGLRFELTSDVLIPRPETEELVDWIAREYDRNAVLSMVDVGTGSGCIAVSLAAYFPNADVWAVDVSEAALDVAKRNALKNKVKINFLADDVLKDGTMGFESASLDVLASNPPYVAPSEKALMLPNVLKYEPHCALFTPENDPLIFYRRIAALGTKCLKDRGKVFFEINEAFSAEVAEILQKNNYSDIILRKDVNGKWRMVSAELRIA